MPRGKRYKAPEQSFLGNHSIDDLAKAATPEEYKEENMKNIVHHTAECLEDLRFHKIPFIKYRN